MNDIISTRIIMHFSKTLRLRPSMLHIPRRQARFILILALSLILVGCSPAAAKDLSPTQTFSTSAVVSLEPVQARATTLARQVPASLDSREPQSAVEITPNAAANLTSTPAFAAPPTATATPTRTRLPLQSSDLLYLAPTAAGRSALMRWDHYTGFASLLADNVEQFSASADGKKILLLRPLFISANGKALYNLDTLDYAAMQTAPLIEQMPQPYHLVISPDGGWFAYQEEAAGGVIHARRTDTPDHHVELGECDPAEDSAAAGRLLCTQLAWSPDSRQVAWSDARGLWISAPFQPKAQLLHNAEVSVSDPRGNQTQMKVMLHNLAWSPAGRFIAMQVTPSLEGVHWQAVIDARLGKMVDIPDSAEYTARSVSVHWYQTGSLVVAHGGGDSPPFVKIWDVLPTNLDLMVLKRSFELDAGQIFQPWPATTQTAPTQAQGTACLDWFSELNENSFLFGLTLTASAGDGSQAALISLNLIDGRAQKLVDLPPDTSQALWAPDGSGALILGIGSPYTFFSLANARLVDLRSVIAAGATGFVWLPPALRR